MDKYKIVRCFFKEGKKSRVIKRGLSLEAAQKYCQDPKTRHVGNLIPVNDQWFDGYTKEE